MADIGNELTEKELMVLENRIKKEYRQAALEVSDKFDEYMRKFAEQDAKKAQDVKDGKITFGQYREWRKNKMLSGKRYEELRNQLVRDLVNADKIAMAYIDETLPSIYATNINTEIYNIEHETHIDTSFTLYNADTVRKLIKDNPNFLPINPKLNIPKDELWNRQHINSAITQGILQGEGIPKITKRLQHVTDMDKNAAIRNARTCVTGAQNAGRMDGMKREIGMGIALKKVWLATLDSRTRDSHVLLDGEERELDEEFSNGLLAPANDGGGGHARPEEIYNCRCRLGRQYDKYKTDWSNLDLRYHDKLGDMTYEQWKEEHRKHAEAVAKRREERQSKNATKMQAPKIQEPKPQKIQDENYTKLDNIIKQNYNIKHKEVINLAKPLTEKEIITKLAGGDMTDGSCSSLAYAYIGNICGYDVTDFRGGDSQKCFASFYNNEYILKLKGVKTASYKVKKEASDTAKLLKELDFEHGKEYRLSCGKHAAIIRNSEKGYEYLELQSNKINGWKPFEYTEKYIDYRGNEKEIKHSMETTLYERFGCRKTVDKMQGHIFEKDVLLTEVESFKGNEDFKELLGYINTASDQQKKGVKGSVK